MASPVQSAAPNANTVFCKQCHCELLVELAKRCARCQGAIYCSPECQRANWATHKPFCCDLLEMVTKTIESLKRESKELTERIKEGARKALLPQQLATAISGIKASEKKIGVYLEYIEIIRVQAASAEERVQQVCQKLLKELEQLIQVERENINYFRGQYGSH